MSKDYLQQFYFSKNLAVKIDSMFCSRLSVEHARLLTCAGISVSRIQLILPCTHSQASYPSRLTDLRIDDKRMKILGLRVLDVMSCQLVKSRKFQHRQKYRGAFRTQSLLFESWTHNLYKLSSQSLYCFLDSLMKLWIIAQAYEATQLMKNYDNDITSSPLENFCPLRCLHQLMLTRQMN